MLDQLKRFLERYISPNEEEWNLIESCWVYREINKKEFLVRQGEICRYVAFINKGCLRYFYLADKGEVTDHIFFENSFAGDYESFLTQQPCKRNIAAIEPSELLLLNFEGSQLLNERIPAWQQYRRIVAENAYLCAQRHSASLLLDTPETRYLKFIQERPDALERVPKHIIASYLGITPETFCPLLIAPLPFAITGSPFIKAGSIHCGERKIILTDYLCTNQLRISR